MADGLCLHCHDGGGVHAESQSLTPALFICGPYGPPPPPLVSCSAKNRTQGLIPIKQLPSLLTPISKPSSHLTTLDRIPLNPPHLPTGLQVSSPWTQRQGPHSSQPDSLHQSPGAFRWLLPNSHPDPGPLHRLSQKSILLFTEMGMSWHLDPTLLSLTHTVSTGGEEDILTSCTPSTAGSGPRALGPRSGGRRPIGPQRPRPAPGSAAAVQTRHRFRAVHTCRKGELEGLARWGCGLPGEPSNNGRGFLSRGVASSLGVANSWVMAYQGTVKPGRGILLSGAWSVLGGAMQQTTPFGGVVNSGCGLLKGTVSSRGVASSYWAMAQTRGVASS